MIVVNKAYRYRLCPTNDLKIMFAKFIYNKMLGNRLDHYKKTGKNNTPAQDKEEFPWLEEDDGLANGQMNLNKTYNNFLSNRKHFGKPHFKSKKTGYNQHGSVRIEGNKVYGCIVH